jgi:hypothetical protein
MGDKKGRSHIYFSPVILNPPALRTSRYSVVATRVSTTLLVQSTCTIVLYSSLSTSFYLGFTYFTRVLVVVQVQDASLLAL